MMKASQAVFDSNREFIIPKDARSVSHNGDRAYIANVDDDANLAVLDEQATLVRRAICDSLQQHSLKTQVTNGEARDLFAKYLLMHGFAGSEQNMTLDDAIELFNLDREKAGASGFKPEILKSANIVLVRGADLSSGFMLNPPGFDPEAFPNNPSAEQIRQIIASLSESRGGPAEYKEITKEAALDLALEYNGIRRLNGALSIADDKIWEALFS